MAVESYEQIMARLQGQQAQAPTAANDFANYVQTLLLNPNPQGNMMTDAEAYRADPFRRQNAINASLDEALKKKQAEEAARAAAAGGGMGMMGSVSGESGGGVPLTQEQIDFLENEALDQRGERLKNDWFGLKPMAGMLLDPIGTFLTYPKQEATPNLGVGQAKTPYQIWQENWEKTLPVETQVVRNIQKAQMESQQALANSGWNPERTQYTSSYGTTTDSGSISSAESAGLDAARESYGYGSNADYYGD